MRDKRFYALIGMERAMWGDRLGDFISLNFVRGAGHKSNAALVRGYNEVADEPLMFGKETKLRLGFMRACLGMIMFAGGDYRAPENAPY